MNFQELLGGVGKEFMNAAGDALAGAAKEYLGNAIQEIFVRKEADTKRTLSNIQHMRVVSSPAVLRALFAQRIMFSVWRLLGDMARQRLSDVNTLDARRRQHGSSAAPRDLVATYVCNARIGATWSRPGGGG